MKYQSLLFLLICLVLSADAFSQENTYPTKERLFHIERSKNKNMVCYDVNLVDGRPDEKEPLNVYWINREESPGQKKGLSAIQKRMAYGYKQVSRDANTCQITLQAYPGRVLTLRLLHGKYVCTLEINGKQAVLNRLYVKAKENNSLKVEYVELTGTALDTQSPVSERVLNK
ncbi:DUF4833 domain-containing protein [Parabacteroides sp. PF5-6]|uniref:DUF4833 domain-containing protein n=1 Tax=Parabacteroides sp. PF5-6 TaxID=1742403 RepID=UPI0024073EED|nr:DUF4833 domain-containing protein [Parabacteroides sp. PF5-6]MDF9831590.1 hypothetical protein [Parabacteroides sp. PF5-6]